jgi:LysM repeat protein
MKIKKLLQLAIVAILLFTSFAVTGQAHAVAQCSASVVVQWGDTLSGIASYCGTTVDALLLANPGIGWWLYAGQILNIPSSSATPLPPITGSTYVVQPGDTLQKIATRAGTTINGLLAVNPQITNINLIYVGQVIKLPSGGSTPPPVITPTPPTPSTPPTWQPGTLAYSPLRITYKHGMYIRTAPNGVVIASAQKNDILYYRPGSDVADAKGRIWVEVKLYPPTQGYATGWMMVRDQLGTYFTRPRFRIMYTMTK